jgi:ABC-type multidrug transport system fused ATPase/permease subunit
MSLFLIWCSWYVAGKYDFQCTTREHRFPDTGRLFHRLCSLLLMLVGVCVMVAIIPWLLLAILPVTVSYYYLLLHYRKSGSDLQRLDAVSRSPIQAMVSEALDGSSTIRVFHQQYTFLQRFYTAVDINSSALLNFVSAQRYVNHTVN